VGDMAGRVQAGDEEVKDGLAVDVELESPLTSKPSHSFSDEEEKIVISAVHASVPGISVSLDNSRHWIPNEVFVQPLASVPLGEDCWVGCWRGRLRGF
jgi:hypothetical protein